MSKLHTLFVCSRNQWRSPTAERVWQRDPGARGPIRRNKQERAPPCHGARHRMGRPRARDGEQASTDPARAFRTPAPAARLWSCWTSKTPTRSWRPSWWSSTVADPALRERLTPDYTIGCKRIILSRTLLAALCKPQTSLHDRHDGVAEILPTGIRAARGTTLDLDAIVVATGLNPPAGLLAYPVVGREGRTLAV